MSETTLRKCIAQATKLFGRSNRGMMITDKNYRLKWTNDIDLAQGQLIHDSSGCRMRIVERDIPLQKTEIMIEEKPFFLLCRYCEDDMLSFIRSVTFDRVYSIYGGRIRIKTAEYLKLPELISDPIEAKKLSDEIKRCNTRMLSAFINANVLTHLLSLDMMFDLFGTVSYLKPFLDNAVYIAKVNGLELSYTMQDELFIRTDMKLLKCVIANLIINAFMYNKSEEKRAWLDLCYNRTGIYIKMSDNGGGIEPLKDDIANKPFRSEHNGEGLGLYLAQLYAKCSGGDMTLENKDGGLVVTLKLSSRLRELPDMLRSPPPIAYPTLLEPEYLILAKCMDTVKGGCDQLREPMI